MELNRARLASKAKAAPAPKAKAKADKRKDNRGAGHRQRDITARKVQVVLQLEKLQQQGLSQRTAAAQMGVSQGKLSKWRKLYKAGRLSDTAFKEKKVCSTRMGTAAYGPEYDVEAGW